MAIDFLQQHGKNQTTRYSRYQDIIKLTVIEKSMLEVYSGAIYFS